MVQNVVDPRLRELLEEADRSLHELRNPRPDGPSAKDIMRHLDALHRDLGRRLHDLWHVQNDLPHDVTDDIDMDTIDDLTELPPSPTGRTVPPLPEGLWVDRLQDLLALLDAPGQDTDAVALALEASRVQWATVALDARWAPFPEPIQVALLGLLAARCRWLCEHMTIDLGPLRAIDRLRRYQTQTGLSIVVALVPDREPESGSWYGDALHWWDMLTAGLTE